MKFKLGLLFLLISLSVVLPPAPASHAAAASRQKKPALTSDTGTVLGRETVRVGVIYYDDFQKRAKDFQDVISTLTKNSNRFDFRLVVGTYDEVLDWYQKSMIDIAVMTPG
ncbi:MAG TPA: hypothetical protein VD835_09250, partial [Pyrinomonadaceae bacterium]|nr:hypothetical protein [Pyrinomonadaceae bacterium]